MIDFIWNMHQQGQIAEVRGDAARAKDEVSRYKDRIQDLEFTLSRTTLACQALWEILQSRLGITEAELLAKISEIDLRDGVKDQRMTPVLTTCPECARTLNTKASRCLYCGAALAKPHLFQ